MRYWPSMTFQRSIAKAFGLAISSSRLLALAATYQTFKNVPDTLWYDSHDIKTWTVSGKNGESCKDSTT